MKSMKSKISSLWYDEEVVNNLKEQKINKEILYTHLITGKITLKEYLSLM